MKKRILVVENDYEILSLLEIVLEEAGYDMKPCMSDSTIFEHILQYNPDAILLDIVKPSEQGTKLCREIKAAETTKHIPVIVLSTHPKIEVVKEICADEVVSKPFDIDTLLEVLKDQL